MAANLPNLEAFLGSGMDPVTGLPAKLGRMGEGRYKAAIKSQLRIIDEQDAVNRFTWYNLPQGITQKLMERIIYYRASAVFYYDERLDRFFFLPYANTGELDVYGRYNYVKPIAFCSGETEDSKGDKKNYIPGDPKAVKWDVVSPETLDEETLRNGGVILYDYTPQYSQIILPRAQLQDACIDIMADCLPFLRTALLGATGVNGLRVQGEDEQSNVEAASRSVNAAALRGDKWIPVVGSLNFQELTGASAMKSEEFLLAMQGLDNFRLSTYGLSNGGIFQKKSHILESEENMNAGNTGLILQDSLKCRQDFCDIVNSIWGLGIWCEPSECVIGDVNGDGFMEDNEKTVEEQAASSEPEGGDEDV